MDICHGILAVKPQEPQDEISPAFSTVHFNDQFSFRCNGSPEPAPFVRPECRSFPPAEPHIRPIAVFPFSNCAKSSRKNIHLGKSFSNGLSF